MTERTAFERQLAGEIEYEVGPPRKVDATAITQQAKTTTHKWRFLTMSSAFKFAAAAGALAIAGVFVLAVTPDDGAVGPPGAEQPSEVTTTEPPSMFNFSPVPGPPEFSEDPATGLPIAAVEWSATDPRAAGTMTAIEDGEEILADSGSFYTLSSSVRIENDGGTWVGTSTGVNVEADDAGMGGWFHEYTGEGGYAGLKMYLFRTFADLADEGTWVGFIVPASAMPPIPELPAE